MKLREIAERLPCRLDGDGDVDILRIAGIQQAQAGDLTFVANSKYLGQLATTAASAVILRPVDADRPVSTCARLFHDDPYSTFSRALGLFARPAPPALGVDPLSAVAAGATIGADVAIGPFVSIGGGASIGARTIIYPNVVVGPGARVGEDCVIHSHVSIRERVVLGHRVVLQDGVVVGSDGYGFAKQPDGTHVKIPQHADVVIEDDVEIGANSTIDRPAVGETRIGAGTKLDNLVQIGHGVIVGRRVLLAAQVGIAGSTVVEDDVVMGGQVGVGGHIRIGRGVMAGGQSGITRSIDAGQFVSAYPAIDNLQWRKAQVIVRNLPALKKRLAELAQKIAELEEKVAAWPSPDR